MIYVSASQIETHLDCARKWWFSSVKKLWSAPKTSLSFGIVLHEVAERFMSSDDLGRDDDGNKVDLYPPGWEKDLSTPDQALIVSLIAKAIDAGVLERQPGRLIEYEFKEPIAEDLTMVGVVDVLMPDAVWDHKTTSHMRYAKSPAMLAESPQMLIYGYHLLRKREREGASPLKQVTLRHNVFLKDRSSPVVRKTEAFVSAQAIEDYWHGKILPLATRMRAHRERQDWHDFSDPEGEVCNKYGGCPYLSICGGRETVEKYQQRILLPPATSSKSSSSSSEPTNRTLMGSFSDRLAALAAAKKSSSVATKPEPKPEPIKTTVEVRTEPPIKTTVEVRAEPKPAPKTEPKPAPVPKTEPAPPWAVAECKSCSGSGFNSRGNPCFICDTINGKAKRPKSKDYVKHVDEEGNVLWLTQDEFELVAEQKAPEVTVKEVSKDVEVKTVETKTVTTTTSTEVLDEVSSEDAELRELAAPNPKRSVGRPKKGYTLYINCAPVRGGNRSTIHLAEMFSRVAKKLADDQQADSFFALPVFSSGSYPGRRDALARASEGMVDVLGTDDIIATTGNPDMDVMVKVLEAFAGTVVSAVR